MKDTTNNCLEKLPSWLNNPVLIYGPRKSGSTLLQNLLDGGHNFLIYPAEIKLKLLVDHIFYNNEDAEGTYSINSRFSGNVYKNFDEKEYICFRNKISKSEPCNLAESLQYEIYALHQGLVEKPKGLTCWGMKEVGGKTKSIIYLFRQLFYRGKIILVFREPFAITRSVILNRRRKGVRMTIKQLIKQTIDPINVLEDQFKLVGKPGVYALCYEDLTDKDKMLDLLKEICSFLDISYSDILTKPTIFGVSVIVRTSSKATKEVFSNNSNWYESLTLREIVIVYLTSKANYFIKSLFKHRRPIHYKEIRKKLSMG